MEENKNYIEQIKISKKPNVPEGFFEKFTLDITQTVLNEENTLPFEKNKLPKVPKDFFNSFPDKILKQVEPKIDVVNPTISKKKNTPKIIFISLAVAASLLLFFNLNIFKNQKINDPKEVFLVEESEADLELLSYFTLEELIDYESENSITYDDDEIDELYNEVKNHWSFYE